MNAITTAKAVQKVQLIANIHNLLQNKLDDPNFSLPTGRRITMQHFWVAQCWAELAVIHGGDALVTNRGNLAKACKVMSNRSVYNYLLDFQHIGWLHWHHSPKATNPDDIEIIVKFEPLPDVAAAGHRSDSPHNAKFATTNIPIVENNTINSSSSCGKVASAKIETKQQSIAQKLETKQKKAEQGQQQAPIELNPHFSEDFRGAPESEQREIKFFAAQLTAQACSSLWAGQSFRREVQEEMMQFFAVYIMHYAFKNKELRKKAVKNFCGGPAYQAADDRAQVRMLTKFMKRQPFEIAMPFRAAFSILSRAIEIQRENCKKKGYECYYPTYYLPNFFGNAVEYAITEKRTLTTQKGISQLRLDHCAAKMKINDAIQKGIHARRDGMKYALAFMRSEYQKFKAWIGTTTLSDDIQKLYLERFVHQIACLK